MEKKKWSCRALSAPLRAFRAHPHKIPYTMPKNGSTGLLGGRNGDVLESDLVKQVLKSELLKQILYVLKTHLIKRSN